jgi:hypothetical protein
MRTKLRGKISLLFMTFGLLLAIPAVALADNIVDELEGAATTKTITAGGSFTNHYWIVANSAAGSPSGCDVGVANDGKTATFSIVTPPEVTATPSSLEFDECRNGDIKHDQAVTFTSDTPNADGYPISASKSGGTGSYNTNPSSFTLVVNAPAVADADGDGVADNNDNCPTAANANQADADGDGIGDACDSTPNPPPADTTPPVISKVVTGTLGNNGWYTSDVNVDWTVSDPESAISSQSGCDDFSITSDQQEATYTCTAKSSGGTSNDSVTIKRDATKPTDVSGSPDSGPDHNGWYNQPVDFTFTGQDATSGIAGCSTLTYSGPDGTGKTVDGRCTDNAGNQSALVASSPIDYDATAPTNITFSGISNGDKFDFGDVPAQSSLGCSAEDATSGFDSCSIVSGYGTSVDNHTLTAKAFDQAGNSATNTLSYSVIGWTLKGFYPPVDMGIHNTMKGGQTVALKFEIFKTLSGAELTDTSVIKTFTQKVNCTTSGGVDAVEDFATGNTTLRYDTTSGQFIFNWKSPKAPGTCYRVTMTTQDGSSISADFTLK